MENKDVIGDSQHGRWSLTILVTFYNGITTLVARGRATDIVYLDLCKTFDTVPMITLSLSWKDIDLVDGPLSR